MIYIKNRLYFYFERKGKEMIKLSLYASIISVLVSVYIFAFANEPELAIYIGLWAPSLILYGQAYEQANKSN